VAVTFLGSALSPIRRTALRVALWIEQFFRHIAQPTAHDRNKNIARSSNLELEIEGVAACLSNQIWDRPSQATGRDPTPEAAQAAAETNWIAEAQREQRNPTQDATAGLFLRHECWFEGQPFMSCGEMAIIGSPQPISWRRLLPTLVGSWED